ncbi:MAG: tetratricopeptide repeat protein [Brevundimonas sp.]|uniref:tetratricopeptide repeat protein n=1 Tax=Brevundimonas sp. TaxID=1871086 RepID=UPI004034D603
MNPPKSGKRLTGEISSLVVIAAGVWLGWQALLQPMKERLPAPMAIRLAPGSAQVLARAAEAELQADRPENAAEVARASLERMPFNVRALRVLGLAEAREGRLSLADEILTLSGNWSLRDDPSHAWLIEYRLRRGDYGSSFAHADTLARRRMDMHPRLFNLFNAAALRDARSVPALVALLGRNPPWREAYINQLYRSEDGHRIAATLAIALKDTPAPFTTAELGVLYRQLMSRGWLPVMSQVRSTTNQPTRDSLLVNGGFDTQETPAPYAWRLHTGAGIIVELLPDDLREDTSLRAQYGSLALDPLAEQFLQLRPGQYRFRGEQRRESGKEGTGMNWAISCFESNQLLARTDLPATSGGWSRLDATFTVPASGCQAQWIRLMPAPGQRRTTVVGWYDRLAITPQP